MESDTSRSEARNPADDHHLIFMEGLVGRPGVYNMQAGLTLRRALAAAGGLKTGFERAVVINTDPHGVSHVRFTLTEREFLESAAGPDIELKPNDLVRVE